MKNSKKELGIQGRGLGRSCLWLPGEKGREVAPEEAESERGSDDNG